VKATPAFNLSLCTRFRVKPLEFDGMSDSLFHPFDEDNRRHMEYVRDRGSYADVPAEEIRRVFARRIRSTSTSGRTPRSSASRPPDAGPARGSFRAAVAAADPLKILAPHLPAPPRAALSSPRQARPQPRWRLRLEKSYRGDLEGIAITRYGHGLPTRKIRVVEAGHPVPDEAGEAAAREILTRVKG
jgi:hypothetical protein